MGLGDWDRGIHHAVQKQNNHDIMCYTWTRPGVDVHVPVCTGKAAAVCEAAVAFWRRVLEDYAVLYFGPALFKIARLLLVAMMCVRARLACIDTTTRRRLFNFQGSNHRFYSDLLCRTGACTSLPACSSGSRGQRPAPTIWLRSTAQGAQIQT